MRRHYITLFILCLFALAANAQPIDPSATRATVRLFESLREVQEDHILYGHQDALSYGYHWNEYHKRRSDVNDVCGDFPAVFGWDVGKIGQQDRNLDKVSFDHMRDWIKQVYKMGGISTISWHMDNPLTGGNAWDTGERVVASILPGGSHHELYRQRLDAFADFAHSLRVGFIFKKKIPIIFRPFHEHTGSWFWWGQPHCTPEEYIALWRYTVDYLREERGVHHLLYGYSPDVFRDAGHYLECYPGDDYVDLLGLDDYHDVGDHGSSDELVRRLRIVAQLAADRGKIAALTETGSEAIPDESWWTERLLYPIKNDPIASRITYILTWRNANHEHDRPDHHYGPVPGHSCVPDFMRFYEDEMTWFVSDLPGIY